MRQKLLRQLASVAAFTATIILFTLSSDIRRYKQVDQRVTERSNSPEDGNMPTSPKYIINCQNINQIKILQRDIDDGRSKTVDVGFFKGQKVVIKRISNHKLSPIQPEYRQLLFLKEILIRDQLNHAGLVKMFGYCVRSIEYDSYTEFYHHGELISAFEYGDQFNASDATLSVQRRLDHAIELTDLLMYLETSHLGSLVIGDFKAEHFVMVNGRIKLIDLDYIHNIEFPCRKGDKTSICPYHLKCKKPMSDRIMGNCVNKTNCSDGVCSGYNAKFNLDYVNIHFLTKFLQPKYFPMSLHPHLNDVHLKLKKYKLTAEELLKELRLISQKLAFNKIGS